MNRITAVALGGSGPRAEITATARPPRWTVMVYLAADNNLSIDGINDIDEMEAAGLDPEVQVVVQAEFNPGALSMIGCTSACFNRPNFNTFRYIVNGQGAERPGPNGATVDVGNRNMTNPSELRDFVAWGKSVAPAERYALVLWNHGSGYSGLIEDITSAGSRYMSLQDVNTALTGAGVLDVVDFDMCLMGTYESLVVLKGLAKNVVFSQELEPGAGNPYTEILDRIQAASGSTGREVASFIVEEFHRAYTGNRASTTKSAFDMSHFDAFDASLGSLATALGGQVSSYAGAMSSAAAGAQRFEVAHAKDLSSFLDSLRTRVTDQTIRARIDAVNSQISGPFRILSRVRTGSSAGARNVSRAVGLSILMPSVQDASRMPGQGPESFASYQNMFSGRPWTQLLEGYLAGVVAATYADQGINRLELYLLWDPASAQRSVDVDLWVLEPSGNLFIPYLGVVTPNGTLTGESTENGISVEGYATRRFVEYGTYRFYANLFSDPTNSRPWYDVAFRQNPLAPFTFLYTSTRPRLSLQTSWLNDPSASFARIDAGTYTDLRLAATWSVAPQSLAAATPSVRDGRLGFGVLGDESPGAARITPEQMATVKKAMKNGAIKRSRASLQALQVPKGLQGAR